MKFGVRKPSLKKSVSARTTGRAKRKLKRMVNPFYGKKGMGWIRNPRKALYNKVYRKTSVSSKKMVSGVGSLLALPFIAVIYMAIFLIWFSVRLIWWVCVMVVNGIIALAEFIINLNADGGEPEYIETNTDTMVEQEMRTGG